MSRSGDGYYRSGPRRRPSDNYGGSGGFEDYSDSYGSRRSSRDSYSHDRHRSSGGGRGGRPHRGRGMVSPWEGGVVPGSGGGRGGTMPMGGGGAPDIVASINELSRMDNPESELALNILNAVLGPKEEAGWGEGGRDWGGSQKRRMDWDNQYNYSEPLGDGILPTPAMPPRKMPRREAYSWGVVDGFSALPVLKGRKAREANKKKMQLLKPKPKTAGTTSGTAAKTTTTKTATGTDKAKGAAKAEGEKAEGGEEGKENVATDKKEEDGDKKGAAAEGKEGEAKEGEKPAEGAEGDGKVKKTPVKKKEEPPVPVSYLRCHLCQMNKFNSQSNFMDHIRSKKHRRMIVYYGEKIAATEKLLKAQSWLKSQRNIVSMSKQKGKITRCVCCECPIKGGRWTHIHIREHMLLYHFTKCFTCKLKFMNRSDLEQHKLTATHMKAQFTQDKMAMDRFLRWSEKSKKETHIPEQKQSEEFHEMVKVMQMNNLDTFVWNKDTIPIYDPARPSGLNHLVKRSHFVCSVCPQRVSQTASEALEHCKTKEHYECLAQYLKTQEKEEEEAEKKREEQKKKDELKKKEDLKKKEEQKKKEEKTEKENKGKEEEVKIKQEKKEEQEDEEGKEEDATNKEEEEEGGEEEEAGEGEEVGEEEEEGGEEEEEEEEEENGMKDMENMEVIDEEGNEGGGEEEEDEGEGDMEDLEEVGEDMDEIGEDLLDEEEEEEDDEGGEDAKDYEDDDGKEKEKGQAEDKGRTTTASTASADESSAPARKTSAPPPAPVKAQPTPQTLTRSARTRGVRGARGGM